MITENDLKAIQELDSITWNLRIDKWAEKNIKGSMWMVSGADKDNVIHIKNNESLSKAIKELIIKIK